MLLDKQEELFDGDGGDIMLDCVDCGMTSGWVTESEADAWMALHDEACSWKRRN